jgi:methylmalonyl-CoA mutase cobalamin-binding subunit
MVDGMSPSKPFGVRGGNSCRTCEGAEVMDGLVQPVTSTRRVEDMPLRRFAMRVVSELTRASDCGNGPLSGVIAKLVTDFARSGDNRALSALYAEMRLRRISAEDVMDAYLPDALGMIGQEWHDEEIDILHASMACARLQNLLRELGRAWASDRTGRMGDGRILMTLPAGEQHTVGLMLAANQLRRIGVSVKVMLLPKTTELRDILTHNRFHAVFISVSNESSLLPCGHMVRDLRTWSQHHIPIVIGGGLVSGSDSDNHHRRIAEITGADLVTSDISRALHSCGIQQISAAAE